MTLGLVRAVATVRAVARCVSSGAFPRALALRTLDGPVTSNPTGSSFIGDLPPAMCRGGRSPFGPWHRWHNERAVCLLPNVAPARAINPPPRRCVTAVAIGLERFQADQDGFGGRDALLRKVQFQLTRGGLRQIDAPAA